MATQKAISANTYKPEGNTGVVFQGGAVDTVDGPIPRSLTIAESTDQHENTYGSKVVLAVSPAQSGNLGTAKALAAGVFAGQEEGKYVAKILGTRVAQTDNTFLRSGASDIASRDTLHYKHGDRALQENSWDYETGAVTKGANAGSGVYYVDPETGSTVTVEARPSKTVPGRFTFMVNGKTATNNVYSQRND